MKKNIVLEITLITILSTKSLIADAPILIPEITNNYYSMTYKTCMINAKNNADYSICIGGESEIQDLLLNKMYKNTMDGLSSSRKNQLRNAQKAWMKYRDANCNWYYNPNGGSSARIESAQCYLNMTVSRRLEMEWDGFYG